MKNELSILTTEELTFLKELARELKTQDNIATAKPLIYTIREKVVIPGCDCESSDGEGVFDEEDEFHIDTDVIVEYILDHYAENSEQTIEALAKSYDLEVDINSFEDLVGLLDELGEDDWEVHFWRYEERFKGSFLTAKAAERHLKGNRHHYEENAEVYCTHGWRNPELEKLLSIVEKFDTLH